MNDLAIVIALCFGVVILVVALVDDKRMTKRFRAQGLEEPLSPSKQRRQQRKRARAERPPDQRVPWQAKAMMTLVALGVIVVLGGGIGLYIYNRETSTPPSVSAGDRMTSEEAEARYGGEVQQYWDNLAAEGHRDLTGSGIDCHPSYAPCLESVRDYDCAGSGGDGPEFTGRVEVSGYDEYNLDADGDGVGCE